MYIGMFYHAMKCYREKSFGDKAFNIYWCKKPPMTICCTEGGKFTCCEDKSAQHLMQQLQIWGSVFGIVFLVVAVYLYYRVENNICDGNKNLKELCMTCCYCKCIRRKKKKDKMIDDYEDIDGSCEKNGSLRNFDIDVISMNRMDESDGACATTRRVSLNLENMSHCGSIMSRQSIYEKRDSIESENQENNQKETAETPC
ncbi:uncharacterized protein LOC135492136 isoform X2 [Lineus longissimus]|uniref:uncharacterized protein LOC135492136 isoform X2 n=1 Tax=Lineus longissimus TaxID=88925 RepID=UPI00315CB6F1